jgi:hypothetical protein
MGTRMTADARRKMEYSIKVAEGGFAHPLRLRIAEAFLLIGGEASSAEVTRFLKEDAETREDGVVHTLGSVSYHVRALRDLGLLYETRTMRVRGAIQTFYVLSDYARGILAP